MLFACVPSSFLLSTKKHIAFAAVSKMWAKKNAIGKEQVAKLVDDTYRLVLTPGSNAVDDVSSCFWYASSRVYVYVCV